MQRQWSFLDVTGHRYHIGIYHGQDSGHFLMYINNKITIIDFHILQDKSYTLYIGSELFRLNIARIAEGDFRYDMEPVSTRYHQNQWEKVRDQIIFWIMLFLILIMVFTLAFLFLSKIT